MPSILIVDDDADGRDGLATFLNKCGYSVTAVPNGKAALSAVLANTPDLVVLDLFMPEMDGGSFLEVVRSYLRLQSLPVVIFTGLPDSPLVDRARALKVNAILVKGKATYQDVLDTLESELKRLPT